VDKLLERVKKEFIKLHESNGTPSKELKGRVAELLSYYSRKFISKAIKVNPDTLSNWKIRNKKPRTKVKEETKFVQISPINPITLSKDSTDIITNKLEVMLPNNIKLLINNSSIKEAVKIIRYVVEEFS
jgi:hypothetical protein